MQQNQNIAVAFMKTDFYYKYLKLTMKSKAFMFLVVVMFVAAGCNEKPGLWTYDGTQYKGYYTFAQENVVVNVDEDTAYFEFEITQSEIEEQDRIVPIVVYSQLTTAEAGKHYTLPKSMSFKFPAGEISKHTVRIALSPENIDSELALVFTTYGNTIHSEDRPWEMEDGEIYATTVTLKPAVKD